MAVLDALLSTIQRDLNCLTDSDRSLRKRALESLDKRLFDGDVSTPKPTPESLQAVLPTVLPPVLRLFGDPVEKCRELSIQLTARILSAVADPAALFPRLLPAIDSRIGALPVQEPSEEIRLSLLRLFLKAADSSGGPALADFMPEVTRILATSLGDAFHEIKKAACLVSVSLARCIAPDRLEPSVPALVTALIANLAHRHSQVRLACLRAVDGLICTAAPPSIIAEVLTPGVRPIVFDHAPGVRELLFDLVARWLACAPRPPVPPPGAPSVPLPHAPQLLPLLLLGVSDESLTLAQRALAHVESVGVAWDSAASVDGSSSMCIDGEDSVAPEMSSAAAAAAYPSPFSGRPGPGARRMIAALLPLLLAPVLKDLKEWTVGQRTAAARLLHTVVIFAEGSLDPHLAGVVPALVSAVGDDDPALAALLVASAHAIGLHVPARSWVPLVLELVAADRPACAPAARANALVVLAALLRFAPGVGEAEASAVADALSSELVRGSDLDAVRAQALAVITNLVAACGSRLRCCSRALFHALLALSASEGGSAAVAAGAAEQLRALEAAVGGGCGTGLHGLHAAEVLDAVAAEAPQWASSDVSGRAVLVAFLRSAPPEVLREHSEPRILPLLSSLLSSDRDLALRLSLLQSLDSLFEDAQRGPALLPTLEVAEHALSGLLVPSLIWRAGKPAAAVRYAAVVALGTVLRRGLVPRDALLAALSRSGLLAALHGALEEEFYVDTRLAAAHAEHALLSLAGPGLSDEQRRAVYPELTKRMDDSRPEVRIAAAHALRAFAEAMPAGYCETNTGYLLKALIVHMDDADPAIQEVVCETLETFARLRPALTSREVEAVRGRHRSPRYCDRVLAAAAPAAMSS